MNSNSKPLGVASGEKENWLAVRNERDVQSSHYHQALSKLSDERAKALSST